MATGRLELIRIDIQRAALLGLQSLAARTTRQTARPAHLLTGERGEFEALFFLRRQGFQVVERRWRTSELNGDLDLIAWEGDKICFVEVKTRRRRDMTPAASAVDSGKQRMLRRMADAYGRTLPAVQRYNTPFRFDVVSVYLLDAQNRQIQCELVRNAFPAGDGPSRRFAV
jgi:putative endonuclease